MRLPTMKALRLNPSNDFVKPLVVFDAIVKGFLSKEWVR